MTDLQDRYAAAKATLETHGQGHVLHFYEQLGDADRVALLKEIEDIDWPEVGRLIQTHVKAAPEFTLPASIQPAPWYPNHPDAQLASRYDRARELGEKLVTDGKVAAFTVAGGQGTRLGWDGPKGTFPATPIRELPLFACFAEYLRKAGQKWGGAIPWYVMTSPINDAATCAFFEREDYFGLDPGDVMIFPQGMMPAIDMASHKVLLSDRARLALSPNGHGGSLKALHTSGAIDDMKKRGIEHISYTQVDNPIVRMVDPLFIGLHALDQAQMSSKMLPKAFPREKLGNFCLVDGKMTVIEYSNLPDELAQQRTDDGELRFRAGSIALHCIRVDFVESLNNTASGGDRGNRGRGFSLPFNRAQKKVPYLDLETGQRVEPDAPNAVKLETFVFDALPLCEKSIIYETDRLDEFAPIKNADAPPEAGKIETDSPASSRRIQSERAARWLESRGVDVERDAGGDPAAVIELRQSTAIYPEDLDGLALPPAVGGDAFLR